MFSFGRRDPEASPTQKVFKSRNSPRAGGKNKKRNGRGRNQNQGINGRRVDKKVQHMNVHNTNDGVEVSLDLMKGRGPASPMETREPPHVPIRPEPVISLDDQLRPRQKVHKVQCSTSFPANAAPSATSPSAAVASFFNFGFSFNSQPEWRPKDHRIPLQGSMPVEAAYDDVLNLLRHSDITDELSTVQLELEQMHREIEALEHDRDYLQTKAKNQSTTPTAARSPTETSSNLNPSQEWDVQRLLDSARLTDTERKTLESKRGNCLTIRISDVPARELFLDKTGAKMSQLLKAGNTCKELPPEDCLTLGPHNCRPGGGATSLRQVALVKDSTNKNTPGSRKSKEQSTGFFFGRDTGKAHTWGRIPNRLYRRLQQAQTGGDNTSCDVGEIVHLSTGPEGAYFVQFRSGETWWGSPAKDDNDFHNLLKTWDVYKVVFGPTTKIHDVDNGNVRKLNSWIILSRDGRAAWKNIPRRLHQRLLGRLASWAAVADVTLGPGDSYFCRYLDGSIDYCLPASIASVCEYIERNGGSITEVSMDPETSTDYLIRHTDLR